MIIKKVVASKRIKIYAFFVGFLFVLLITGITAASATTIVSISPSTSTVSPGQSFKVNISIEPATAIAGAQLNLQFNSSIVNVNSVKEGELFLQKGSNTLFNPVTIDKGVVTHVWGNILSTSGVPKDVSTPGTFAVINLTASDTITGSSPLELISIHPISVKVCDPDGNAVPINVINGTVNVNRAPELVGDWHFDEGEGTTAYDSYEYGNDGTITGAEYTTSSKIGEYALQFDGAGDYVEVQDSASLDITDAVTVVAWINPDTIDSQRSVLGKRDSYTFKTSGSEIRFTTPGKKDHTSTGAGLVTGSWQHVAVVFVADDMVRFYKNGEFISSDSASTMSSSTYPLLVGNNQWNERFGGIIDEVKIYNWALGTEEIKADYEAGIANQPPVVDSNGPFTGTEGVPISFDGSTSSDADGSIVSYVWDFGDGNTTTGVTPAYTYAQDGDYTITLTVTDDDGATGTDTTTATIADTAPTADFSTATTSGTEPLTVDFYDNSTSYDGIETWEWDFDNDDVTDSTEQNPTYVYEKEGVYSVSLKVYECDGDSDAMTKSDYVTVTRVNNAPDKPSNPVPYDGATEVPINEAVSWTGGDPDAEDTVTYDVYFGTDTNPPLVSENQMETVYDPGTLNYQTNYYWQIVATDINGESAENEVWSFTTAASPGSDLVAEWQFDEGRGQVVYDASVNGNDGTIHGTRWTTGKLGSALEFDGAGDYVEVQDSASLDITDAVTVVAWINPDTIDRQRSVLGKRDSYTFKTSSSEIRFTTPGKKDHTSNGAGLVTGSWQHVAVVFVAEDMVRFYKNGEFISSDSASTLSSSTYPLLIGSNQWNQRFRGIIDEVKSYNRALSAEEIRADYEAGTENQPPVADSNGTFTGTEGLLMTFDGSNSSDANGSLVSYVWGSGDGNTTTEETPIDTYAQGGDYTITLTVTDDDGATGTDTTTATIVDTAPTADFSATTTSGTEPLAVAFSDNSTSYDGIETWEWDFDNDDVPDSTEQNPTYVYEKEGVYSVSLKVYECDGDCDAMTKSDYVTVTLVNNAPDKPSNPAPYDGATEVPINEAVSWTGGDPDAEDTVTYDVYFGTDTNPPLVSENQMETIYDPGTRNTQTKYYWQIVATDINGESAESEVWSFTTLASSDSDFEDSTMTADDAPADTTSDTVEDMASGNPLE